MAYQTENYTMTRIAINYQPSMNISEEVMFGLSQHSSSKNQPHLTNCWTSHMMKWWHVFPKAHQMMPSKYVAMKSGHLDAWACLLRHWQDSVYLFLAAVSFSWPPLILKVRFKIRHYSVLWCDKLINIISPLISDGSQGTILEIHPIFIKGQEFHILF